MPPLPVNHGQRLCPRRLAQPRPFPPGFCAARARRAWARAFPSPPGRRARTARTKQGRGLRPLPLLWFCRPAGPAKHRRPPRRPSFLRRQGALPVPLFAAASLLPANRPGKDGCPRQAARRAVCLQSYGQTQRSFFPGEIAQGHGQMPIICNKQKPRGRKADLAATGVHMIQGALFRLL